MIKVLIADDHNLVRSGIRNILDAVTGIKVVGEAESGEDAIRKARTLSPHVILMDIKMPGMGGLEATRKLLATHPGVRILIVTVCDDDLYSSRLLQAGALGYLTKGATQEEMVKAIRSVHMGQRYISPSIASQLAVRHLDLTDASGSPFKELSDRELQVAVMVVSGKEPKAIAAELNLSAKTVNSYRYRIFDKFKIKNNVDLTHLAVRYGLLDTNELPVAEQHSSPAAEETVEE